MRTIITALEKVINKYISRGFRVTDYHADNEFDKEALKQYLASALVHIYGREEHAPIIERSTRTVKERSRSICCGLPFKRIAILMVRSLCLNNTQSCLILLSLKLLGISKADVSYWTC